MKDWKTRQMIFHKIYSYEEIGDDLKKEMIQEEWENDKIVQRALEYLQVDSPVLFYPGKSYIIAVTYALLLEKEFGVSVLESLNDPTLLYENDPYFVTFDQNPDVYKKILDLYPRLAVTDPLQFSENFQKTYRYFYLEFLLHEETSIYAPAES